MNKSTVLIAIIIALSMGALACNKSNSDISRAQEFALKPGPFSYIEKAHLGAPRTFYNEMDGSNTC